MKLSLSGYCFSLTLFLCGTSLFSLHCVPSSISPEKEEKWELVWSDEFEGEVLNPEHWSFALGRGEEEGLTNWGNDEWQTYTNDPGNLYLEEGILHIVAQRTQGESPEYSSARIHTREHHLLNGGRIEARMRLPEGPGLWPAFWLLGNNLPGETWPNAGEIDIMELLGQEPDTLYGSLHGPGYSGGAALSNTFTLPEGTFADDFHVFRVEWESSRIAWYVDDQLFSLWTFSQFGDREWVFNQDFYLLLNLAVGGAFPGPPNDATPFPAQMEVDYVRVYERLH